MGMLIILSEGGVAAGVRRIEAITGVGAYRHVQKNQQLITQVADILKVQPQNVLQRVDDLTHEIREKDKGLNKLKDQLAGSSTDDLLSQIQIIDGVNTIIQFIDNQEMDDLRKIGDILKDKLGSGVITLASSNGSKVNFIATATKDILAKGVHCGNLIKEVAKIAGGGGGGRPDMAQAGGKDPDKIGDALSATREILEKQLKGAI